MFQKAKVSAVSALNLPKDVMLGEVLLSFTGSRCLVVENYRSIVKYEDNEIWLQAKNCRVVVRGRHLCIAYYDKEEMKITGAIQAVEFE
ncbi:MAG: YabP/YqfC family sporulation protein [bacterium]|nr:YabP/YqfC family sporulation protein [bacterium]